MTERNQFPRTQKLSMRRKMEKILLEDFSKDSRITSKRNNGMGDLSVEKRMFWHLKDSDSEATR